MPYSESFLIFLLCGEFPAATGAFGPPITGRQWQTLRRILSAAGLSPDALWEAEGRDAAILAGEPIVHRLETRLSMAKPAMREWERLAARGIRVCTWADADYPERLRTGLRQQSPPVLYLSGPSDILDAPGIGVVGSRDAAEDALRFAAQLGTRCAAEQLTVVSGGAVGVDTEATNAALAHGGRAIICCADRLEQRLEQTAATPLSERTLWLSAAHPQTAFAAFRALERNRFIYALSKYAVVVSADTEKGGTWSGATDNLRHGWCPLFVMDGLHIRDGNRLLLSRADVAPLSASEIADNQTALLDRMATLHPLMRYEQTRLF